MNVKRMFLALSALALVFTVSAATSGAEAKMMKKMHHGKMMKGSMMKSGMMKGGMMKKGSM